MTVNGIIRILKTKDLLALSIQMRKNLTDTMWMETVTMFIK